MPSATVTEECAYDSDELQRDIDSGMRYRDAAKKHGMSITRLLTLMRHGAVRRRVRTMSKSIEQICNGGEIRSPPSHSAGSSGGN